MSEVWKDIEGYEGLYQVSSEGRIKSLSRLKETRPGRFYILKDRILTPVNRGGGYFKVDLALNSKNSQKFVHRLVATAFLENPLNKPSVNHIDGNPSNNSLNNLEWVTPKENSTHAKNILKKYLCNESHKMVKLNFDMANEIRVLYAQGDTSSRKLASKFNVSQFCIMGVLKNKRWVRK